MPPEATTIEKPAMPDGLKALLDTELAGPAAAAPPEPTGNERLPGEELEPAAAPPQKPAAQTPAAAATAAAATPAAATPPEKPAAPEKSGDKNFQLAPDFSILADKKPIEIVDVPDMPEQPPEHIKTPKAREDYLKWRANHAGLLREISELRAKTAAPADPELQTRFADLEAQNQELIERVERVDLWASPRFEREKLIPREKNFEAAAGIIKDAGGDPLKLRRALSLTGHERTEALDDLVERISSKTQRDRFGRLIDQIDDQTTEINQMVANARRTNEELRKQEIINRHKNGEKSVEQMKTLLAAARSRLEIEGDFWILKKSEDPEYEWYNKEIDLANQASEELLLHADPEQTALGAILAPQALRLFRMFKNERAARLSLQKEISEMRSAGGNFRRERGQTDGGTPEGLQGVVRKIMDE